jgi:hypothetical protein
MRPTVIVRVTETEFETKDGRVYPHPVPFPKGEVPTPEEFQRQYDRWSDVFRRLLADDEDPKGEEPDDVG